MTNQLITSSSLPGGAKLRVLVITVPAVILWITGMRHDDVTYRVNNATDFPTNRPETCSITEFKKNLHLDARSPAVPRQLLSRCHRVMYNRIPKCASTTFRDVFSVLAPQHNLTAIYLDGSRVLFRKLRTKYKELMAAANHRFILTSHYHFEDFSDVYGDTVAYINIIREPVEWFKSLYFWIRYGSQNKRHRHKDNQTISDCIQDDECFNKMISLQGPRAFLCGREDFCRQQTRESVSRAIENVNDKYLVAGLYEDLPAYMELLQYLMPQVFSNLTEVFSGISDASAENMKTARKDDLGSQVEQLLREKLSLDYAVYNVVKERFYLMYNAARTQKQKGGDRSVTFNHILR